MYSVLLIPAICLLGASKGLPTPGGYYRLAPGDQASGAISAEHFDFFGAAARKPSKNHRQIAVVPGTHQLFNER